MKEDSECTRTGPCAVQGKEEGEWGTPLKDRARPRPGVKWGLEQKMGQTKDEEDDMGGGGRDQIKAIPKLTASK